MIYQRLAKVFLICSNSLERPSAVGSKHGQDASDKLRRHLRALGRALDKAILATFELDKEDRKILYEPIQDFAIHLHFEMLNFVYAQHPELRPPPRAPTIYSDLRWQDVTLPKSVSEADLDAIIFSFLTSRRQKAARVIGDATRHCHEHNLPVSDKVFGARIEALAELGRIQGFGEVKLNDYELRVVPIRYGADSVQPGPVLA
jgi:hypothetical protein